MYCPDTAKALRKADAKRKRKQGIRKYAVLSLQWNNPYTQPPQGMPQVLWAVCVDWPMQDYNEFEKTHAPEKPKGYGFWITFCDYNPQPANWSREAKSRERMRRLRERVEKKLPLFAESYIQQEIALKPSYYAGYTCVPEPPEVTANPVAFIRNTAWPESYAP